MSETKPAANDLSNVPSASDSDKDNSLDKVHSLEKTGVHEDINKLPSSDLEQLEDDGREPTLEEMKKLRHISARATPVLPWAWLLWPTLCGSK